MEDYKLRMIHERSDLYIKIEKLKSYLNGTHFKVEDEWEQLEIMRKYLNILDKRIAKK